MPRTLNVEMRLNVEYTTATVCVCHCQTISKSPSSRDLLCFIIYAYAAAAMLRQE